MLLSKSNFIIILFVSILLAFFAGLKCKNFLDDLDEIGKPTIQIVALQNDSLKETIYLVSKHWGLTGDHSIIVLTTTKPEAD